MSNTYYVYNEETLNANQRKITRKNSYTLSNVYWIRTYMYVRTNVFSLIGFPCCCTLYHTGAHTWVAWLCKIHMRKMIWMNVMMMLSKFIQIVSETFWNWNETNFAKYCSCWKGIFVYKLLLIMSYWLNNAVQEPQIKYGGEWMSSQSNTTHTVFMFMFFCSSYTVKQEKEKGFVNSLN